MATRTLSVRHALWVVTIYFSDGARSYTDTYDVIRSIRENAINRGISCSGMFEVEE